ncbi:MAG: antA/AntB antirepressor family protein [Smithella sp.]
MTNELIPIVSNNNELLVDSRQLHQKLTIATHHRDWMRRRINEYGFIEGIDFRSNLSEIEKRSDLSVLEKRGRGRIIEYKLTLDMAKELAMLENNENGRAIRRYFIEIEKQYRDWIGFVLPRLEQDVNLFDRRQGYDYVRLLQSCGCSTSGTAIHSRIKRNRQEFWRNQSGKWFISESFGKNIIAYAIARRWSRETRLRRLEYEQKRLEVKYNLDF